MKITLSRQQWEKIGLNKKAQSEEAKDVICDSGIKGWQDKLQNVYQSLEELMSYDRIYGICKRLGYEDPETCWQENPTIQGSTNPSDFKKV
jgi:hypothetical protein